MDKIKEIILSKDNVDNILTMLNSPDEENQVVALTCLDNIDFNTNLIYILTLKKEGNIDKEKWLKYAPITSKLLVSLGVDLGSILSYKSIQEILIRRKVSGEQMQYHLDRFAKYLHGSIIGLGYEFIDTLDIVLTLKEGHDKQTGTIS